MHQHYYDTHTSTVNTWQQQAAPSERFPYGLGLDNDEYIVALGIYPCQIIHEDYDDLTQELLPDNAPVIEGNKAVLTYRSVQTAEKAQSDFFKEV